MKKIFLLPLLALCGITACTNVENPFDATGTFEATEIIVSSEVNGKVLHFDAEEGVDLKVGQTVVKIDVLNLALQKEQVEASIEAIGQKQNDARPDVAVLRQQVNASNAQIGTLQTQLQVLEKEQARVSRLFKAEAATQQQLDDLNGKVDVLKKQIASAQAQQGIIEAQMDAAVKKVAIQNRGVTSERKPLQKRVAQIDDQLQRAEVRNPSNGTLLTKYIYAGEFVSVGKPLYKLANLQEMTLRAYITGDQLAQVKVGQTVSIFVDQDADSYKEYEGQVSWISSQAEFTPKTIQTKDERANLVYAIKVKVVNDGYLKIGMYGELNFIEENEAE